MDNLKKLVVAWDLDGTLIDSSHRARRINGIFDLDYWIEKSTEEYIMKDSLLPLYHLYLEYKKTGFTQICVTARPMSEADYKFLKTHGMDFDMILHRSDSQELDQILKNNKLKDYFEENKMIPFMAFDDKQENLEVFDKFGFRTFLATYMNDKLNKNSFQEITSKPKEFLFIKRD